MDLDPTGAPALGLRAYVTSVASRLGLGPELCHCDLALPAGAFVALDRRLANFPTRDVALTWHEEYGWSIAIELDRGERLTALSYLGSDVLPDTGVVAEFVDDMFAGRYPGQPIATALRTASVPDGLDARLAAYTVGAP
jgi:hypothetical protein